MHYVAAVKRKSSSQLHFKTYAFSSRLLFSNTSWSSLLALEVRQSSVRVEMYLWQALLCRHSEIMGNTQLYSNENKLASLRVLNKFSKPKPLINWALNIRKLSKKQKQVVIGEKQELVLLSFASLLAVIVFFPRSLINLSSNKLQFYAFVEKIQTCRFITTES